MIDLITTFNKDIYNEYSKNLLDSFIEKSDDSLRLNIFYEGNFEDIKLKYDQNKNKIRFFEFNSGEWNIFYNKFGHLVEANGFKIIKDEIKKKFIVDGPSYKWNAVKFSYKVFSIFLASNIDTISSKIVWIDADTVCINDLNENKLEKFLPQNRELMTYLGRDNFPPTCPHSETGFIGFNLLHKQFSSFIKTAISFYTTGELFTLERYHDCVVYDMTRRIFEMTGTQFRSLSGEFKSEEHPFVKCGLGNFFDHLKGNRKLLGFSPEHPNNMKKTKVKDEKIKLNFV